MIKQVPAELTGRVIGVPRSPRDCQKGAPRPAIITLKGCAILITGEAFPAHCRPLPRKLLDVFN